MNKSILFILDSFEFYNSLKSSYPKKIFCYSYLDTEEAINNKLDYIVTYDIGHLSFDLEELGYHIFIGYNGHTKEFYSGMSTANGKELRFGHNLRRLLLGGALDNDLGIIRDRNYYMNYDTAKSTHELCEDEKWKSTFNLIKDIANKTIGFNMDSGVKAMTDEESWEWHKKHARINEDGNMIISDDEIGDGSFEKYYKKPNKL